jgi:hypothetical protein
MENFKLQIYLHIIGIGSASGLLLHNESLFIIADNSSFLYEYKIDSTVLNKIALVKNSEENIAKSEKLDFESITIATDEIFILSSGSTQKRKKLINYNTFSKKIKDNDFSKKFDSLMKIGAISAENLNIEGFIYTENKAFLFQRGNGLNGKNGVFEIFDDNSVIKFTPIKLPKIKNVEATFTDAILVNEIIYFLAAVENTTSTYDDGEILGTFIGRLNAKDLTLINTELISEKNKFEGITLFQQNDTEIEFLLCEDKDTDVLETIIYKLKLKTK